MPRLLLLLPTTTYRAEAFLEAARRVQVSVTIGTEQAPESLLVASENVLLLDVRHPQAAARTVIEFVQHHPIDAVIGVDDVTAVTAAAIAEAVGLPHNSVASVTAARNKRQMRELLSRQGIPVPSHKVFPLDGDSGAFAKEVVYPCVVKPLILSASCGVIRANDEQEFENAFRRVSTLLTNLNLAAVDEEARWILVEDFVPGIEVALEGLLTKGVFQPLAMFDKPDPLDGPYFEETLYITPSRLSSDRQQQVVDCADRTAKALGLWEGPVHGEFRLNENGAWVIEMAARAIGGRCSRTLDFSAGISLEELILRHALRMPIPPLLRQEQAAGVMMLPIPYSGMLHEVRGQAEARAVPGIIELTITAEPGELLIPLPEGTRYLGFLLARGKTPEDVERSLREAHQRLTVVISASPPTTDRSPSSPHSKAMRF
ncbi:MAG TPA: ATP-grasp domain-containing protein [Nitrospirales bacterium]|nr:ATP-grasp domain-containing protein [Nitrospirales bacterium]